MPVSRELRAVLLLGSAFSLIFFSWNNSKFVAQPILSQAAKDGDIHSQSGYYSLALYYFFRTSGCLVASTIVEKMTDKIGMIIGAVTYVLLELGFLYPNQWYILATSALCGFGSSVMFSAQGRYLSKWSTPESAQRNGALIWTMQNGFSVFGGFVLYALQAQSSVTSLGQELTDSEARRRAMNDALAALFSPTLVLWLYSIFVIASLIAIVVILSLPPPPCSESEPSSKKLTERAPSVCELLASSFRLMGTREMLLLAPAFGYSGIQMAFYGSIYSTSTAFTSRLLEKSSVVVAMVVIATGVGQFSGGFTMTYLGARVGTTYKRFRLVGVSVAVGVQLIAYLATWATFPSDSSLHQTSETGPLSDPIVWVAVVIPLLLGIGDGCLNTQMYALLAAGPKNEGSRSFSIFRFHMSLFTSATFFYGTVVSLNWHIPIQCFFAVLALVCFWIVDNDRIRRAASATVVPKA